MIIIWFFVTRSSDEAHLRMSPPQGHSLVGVPKYCGVFVAIWLLARQEFTENRFPLIFMLSLPLYNCTSIYIVKYRQSIVYITFILVAIGCDANTQCLFRRRYICIAILYSLTSKFNDVVPCIVSDPCLRPDGHLE